MSKLEIIYIRIHFDLIVVTLCCL